MNENRQANPYLIIGGVTAFVCLLAFMVLVQMAINGQTQIPPIAPLICMLPFIIWCLVRGLTPPKEGK